jgi:hypothetical protein
MNELTKKLYELIRFTEKLEQKDNQEYPYKKDMNQIAEELDPYLWTLEWLANPIKYEGKLIKLSYGRYMIEGTNYEFSTGSQIEYFYEYYDEDMEKKRSYWGVSKLLHNGKDYYIQNLGRDKRIEGLLARIRREY